MRIKLRERKGNREIFTATFLKYGTRIMSKDIKTITILFKNITSSEGEILTNHAWMNCSKAFKNIELKFGDIVKFEAVVKEYIKTEKGNITVDYRLGSAKNVEIIENGIFIDEFSQVSNLIQRSSIPSYKPIDESKINIIDQRFPDLSKSEKKRRI